MTILGPTCELMELCQFDFVVFASADGILFWRNVSVYSCIPSVSAKRCCFASCFSFTICIVNSVLADSEYSDKKDLPTKLSWKGQHTKVGPWTRAWWFSRASLAYNSEGPSYKNPEKTHPAWDAGRWVLVKGSWMLRQVMLLADFFGVETSSNVSTLALCTNCSFITSSSVGQVFPRWWRRVGRVETLKKKIVHTDSSPLNLGFAKRLRSNKKHTTFDSGS